MTDKKTREDEQTTPIKPLPKCTTCGKILLHCKCGEKELKK
jgi:hypothetical protein